MTTNIQLIEMAKKLSIPNFRCVFSKDELTNIVPEDNECLIINLDNSDGSGTHWTSIYRENKKSITRSYYFSSFGDDPPKEVVSYCGRPLLTHTWKIQDFEDQSCGEFCLLFLYLISKDIPYENVILFMVN